jgi:hypothetical protein
MTRAEESRRHSATTGSAANAQFTGRNQGNRPAPPPPATEKTHARCAPLTKKESTRLECPLFRSPIAARSMAQQPKSA